MATIQLAAELSPDLITILKVIREHRGTDCTGSCHHRRPGEFHCHTLAREIKVSSAGVKQRILKLLELGLLERYCLPRGGEAPVIRFQISPLGEKLLALLAQTPEERQ